jgi:tetratricopeptide (TPR) repeat protein
MNLSVKAFGRFILTRVFFIYVLGLIAVYQIVNVPEALIRARMQTLNRIRPYDIGKLPYLSYEKDFMSKDSIIETMNYMRKVKNYRPGEPGLNSVIAYCYYYLGDMPMAIEYYLRDLKENPEYFWSHYNLGLIYFKQGDFDKSVGEFKKVLELRPDVAANQMRNWSVYHQIIGQRQTIDKVLPTESLGVFYQNLYKMLIKGQEELNDFSGMEISAQHIIEMNVGGEEVFYYYSGVAAFERKDFTRAIFFLKKTIEMNKVQILPQAYSYMARAVAAMGNETLSKEFMALSEKLGGGDQPVFNADSLNVRLY